MNITFLSSDDWGCFKYSEKKHGKHCNKPLWKKLLIPYRNGNKFKPKAIMSKSAAQAFNMYMYYGTPLYNKIKLQRDKQKYKLLILCFKRWIDICKNGESYDNDSLYFTVARSNYINFLKSFSNKKVKIARNVLKLCVKHPMFSLHYHIENIFWCILVGKLNHALNIIRHILDWFER
eukprot:439497_1